VGAFWWAAGVVALSIALAFVWHSTRPQTFATAIGEQRAIELEDGSVIQLNAHSHVAVHLSRQARDVRLLDGEALFKVAHDPTPPFRVYADDTVIRAVGTQFNVYRRANDTTVSVIEGRVEISRETSPARSPGQLSAGETARITAAGAITRARGDTTEATAWRQRRLIFRDSTLGDIAAEFNRYNRTPQITVEGDALRARRYGGTFDADDPESLVDFLRPDENLEIIHADANLLVRSRILK
jgi:transmembrane sensor